MTSHSRPQSPENFALIPSWGNFAQNSLLRILPIPVMPEACLALWNIVWKRGAQCTKYNILLKSLEQIQPAFLDTLSTFCFFFFLDIQNTESKNKQWTHFASKCLCSLSLPKPATTSPIPSSPYTTPQNNSSMPLSLNKVWKTLIK